MGAEGRGRRNERKQVHERVFISGRERGLAGLHRTRFEWFSEYCETFFVGLLGLCVNGALMSEDVGVCHWVCGRLA